MERNFKNIAGVAALGIALVLAHILTGEQDITGSVAIMALLVSGFFIKPEKDV